MKLLKSWLHFNRRGELKTYMLSHRNPENESGIWVCWTTQLGSRVCISSSSNGGSGSNFSSRRSNRNWALIVCLHVTNDLCALLLFFTLQVMFQALFYYFKKHCDSIFTKTLKDKTAWDQFCHFLTMWPYNIMCDHIIIMYVCVSC